MGDAVSSWCDGRSLTQATAEALRELGFHNKDELEAIDHRTVEQLNITHAQKCLLRKIVNNDLSDDLNHKHGSYSGYRVKDLSVNSSSNGGKAKFIRLFLLVFFLHFFLLLRTTD